MAKDISHLLLEAFLTQRNQPPAITEFHQLAKQQHTSYVKRALDTLTARYEPTHVLSRPASLSRSLRAFHRLILDSTCAIAGKTISLPPIEVAEVRNGNARLLTPVLFSNSDRVSARDKLVACVVSLLISDHTPHVVRRAKIIFGSGFDVRHVALRGKHGATRFAAEARHLLNAFLEFLSGDAPPPTLQLNRQCEVCVFRQRCYEEAQQREDISLLSGLSTTELAQLRAKGVFTITQLAHTFRPKPYGRSEYVPKHHSQPLQALAIKQQTIFVRKKPTLPHTRCRVYLDVEGVPDEDSFYLIGTIREDLGAHVPGQFWANSCEHEGSMWRAFCDEISTLPDDFALFHYGSYEHSFIERMLKRYGSFGSQRIAQLSDRMCDVHAVIRTNVFFPAYSNRLKDIAGVVGSTWSGPITAGIESITWRRQWVLTEGDRYKTALLQYNQEDCEALQAVVNCLLSLGNESDEQPLKVQQTSHLNPSSHYGFGRSSFALPDIQRITKRAYFNYQQQRILVRQNAAVRRSLKRKRRSHGAQRVNNSVVCPPPDACIACGCDRLTVLSSPKHKRVIKDLKFSTSGIKRWTTEFISQRWQCRRCQKSFYSPDYPTKKPRFGRGVACWVVHQHVANRQSHVALVDNLNDLFGFSFSTGVAKRSIRELATEYHATESSLLNSLRCGQVIFADETKVRVRGGTGYVWAFSGIEDVVYRFTGTRDSQILEEVLNGFQGVLVSDFYGGYDSAACEQQKCIVHLIRDINDDLLKAPFNDELQSLASRFTELIKAIVDDIDKYGLKKRHLKKFIAPASRFQEWVQEQDFRTKSAQRYQKRIRNYGERLFTFLRYDGVPWNNNIAENAIKLVVSRRRFFGASYSREGMGHYLLFLSLFQTLRRKGGSLLRFLLSGESELSAYLGD